MISFLIAVFLGTGIYAQVTETESKSQSKSLWFVRAGANVAGFAGSGSKGTDPKILYQVMVGFQKPIQDKGAYLGMEFAFGSRGFSQEGYLGMDQSLVVHNVQASPFTFGWKPRLDKNLKLDLHVGTFVSYDYTGKFKLIYQGKKASVNLGDLDNWNHFDVGMQLGIGLWADDWLNLDFTYQRGFIEAVEHSSAYTSNFLIRLGFAF